MLSRTNSGKLCRTENCKGFPRPSNQSPPHRKLGAFLLLDIGLPNSTLSGYSILQRGLITTGQKRQLRNILKLFSLKSLTLFWIFLPSFWTLPPQATKHTQSSNILGRKTSDSVSSTLHASLIVPFILSGLFKEKPKSPSLVPHWVTFDPTAPVTTSAFPNPAGMFQPSLYFDYKGLRPCWPQSALRTHRLHGHRFNQLCIENNQENNISKSSKEQN